jgi:hypothetical protein
MTIETISFKGRGVNEFMTQGFLDFGVACQADLMGFLHENHSGITNRDLVTRGAVRFHHGVVRFLLQDPGFSGRVRIMAVHTVYFSDVKTSMSAFR